MDYVAALMHLYPAARPLRDFAFADEGKGTFLIHWSTGLGTPPTIAALKQAWADMHPPRTKADAASAKQTAIDQHANTIRARITAGVSKAEMAGWYRKEREARAYKASGLSTDAPSLDAEATARGVTLAALVDLVIAKADKLASLEAQIAGNAGKHNDAVTALLNDAAATVEQIDAYDFSLGWPA